MTILVVSTIVVTNVFTWYVARHGFDWVKTKIVDAINAANKRNG